MSVYAAYNDTIACAIPKKDYEEDVDLASILLTDLARLKLEADYPQATLLGVEWTFCATEEDIELWTPAHDCADCWETKPIALSIIRQGEGDLVICIGNMWVYGPLDT